MGDKPIILTTDPPGSPGWLAAHKGKLGSTDLASFFRYGPDDGPELDGKRIGRKSELELFLEMTGKTTPEDISESPAVMRGIALEPLIAKLFARSTGREIKPSIGLVQHPTLAFVAVTPDGHTTSASSEEAVAEHKSLSPRARKSWEAGVPKMHRIQGEAMLMTLRVPVVVFVPYCLDQDDVFPIEERADPELQQLIGEKATEFYEKHVLKDIPPPADYDDAKAVRALYRKEFKGKVHEFSAEDEIDLVRRFEIASAITQLTNEKDQIDTRILAKLADAEYGRSPGGLVVRARQQFRKGYTVAEGYSRPLIRVKEVGR